MRLVVFGLACALALGGCVTGPSPERVTALKARLAALKVERDAKRITWTAWSKRFADEYRSVATPSPEENVALTYQTLQASRVDRGEITPEAFEFEMAKTSAALGQREEQQQAANSQALVAAGVAMMTTPANPIQNVQPMAPPPVISCTSRRVGNSVYTNC